MKDETRLQKLNELLGIAPEVIAEVKEKSKAVGNLHEVPEEEIQTFRELQGVIYFLQAPALFTLKTCAWKECGKEFMVSRQFIAFCSYECIRADFKSRGIEWRKGQYVETLIEDPQVYNGQEPIWVRNLSSLEAALLRLKELKTSLQTSQSPSEQSTS